MEVAASLAGFIALTDLLIIRYTRLVDAWKDAPTAVVAIRESLVALRPVLARLDELRALPTADPLFGTSLDTAPFRRILQALQQLADDLTTPAGDIRTWQRTRWTLGKNQRAAELNRNLDSLVALFNIVLLLAMQLVVAISLLRLLALHARAETSPPPPDWGRPNGWPRFARTYYLSREGCGPSAHRWRPCAAAGTFDDQQS